MKRFNLWVKSKGLQFKLINAFLLMGFIVFIVALGGWFGSSQLSEHINEISIVRLPSIVGLQTIDNGVRDVYAVELSLLNTRLTDVIRREQIQKIDRGFQKIKVGWEKYEPLPRTPHEDLLWKQFISQWQQWHQEHERFMEIYNKFKNNGILFPVQRQLELINKGQKNSPEFAIATEAGVLLAQMNDQVFARNQSSFTSVSQALEAVIHENEIIVDLAKKNAERSIIQTKSLVLTGMISGPAIAIILGIILSIAIAKPLDRTLRNLVQIIVSSSTEIAATVAEQERIATQQAISVNQTTTTMDELRSSSQQAANQAELAAAGSHQALTLAEKGTKTIEKTLEGMTLLQKKVEAIAQQIVKLSEQTNQIENITKLVTELANQTNMLALNAAVEAVRAGEQGKGFGVVATEIRKLADQSKRSGEKINQLVTDIQKAINSTVMAADEGHKTVGEGMKLTKKTAEAFSGVSSAIDRVALNSQQIVLTAQQQALAVEQVVEAMNAINLGAQQTASGLSQTKIGVQQMQEVAQNLKLLGIG
ncbi:MAG: methyl-accepting chemotaxis protein [Actinomycetota bacterium]